MFRRTRFGVTPDGADVDLLCIDNGRVEICALTYGAVITSLRVPDRHGERGNVVLGFDELEPYLENRAYFGALVGRFANRIAHGLFGLDGATRQLATNDGPHHLHGGLLGFGRRLWNAAPVADPGTVGVAFTRTSAAGEDEYPGTLSVEVRYLLVGDDTVVLVYTATTDAPTIVNLTQHSYFNLSGALPLSILDHELCIRADAFTPVKPGLIPEGSIAAVEGSPFDFRQPVRVGARAHLQHPQLLTAGGFDHNFVLAPGGETLTVAATLRDPRSGRVLTVRTTEPGLQFYGGHMLDGTHGSAGRVYHRHAGLCLETQHFPDSPNHPLFPSVVTRPGERYSSTTTWQFHAE